MHGVNDFTDVIDACAAGGVHFHHIDVPTFHDGDAVFAFSAGFGRRAACTIGADAVHAFGDDPRGRSFPGAANASHDEGLGNSVGLERVLQRADHRLLPDQISKGFGPVLAGQNLVILFGSIAHLGLRGIRDAWVRSPTYAERRGASSGLELVDGVLDQPENDSDAGGAGGKQYGNAGKITGLAGFGVMFGETIISHFCLVARRPEQHDCHEQEQ